MRFIISVFLLSFLTVSESFALFSENKYPQSQQRDNSYSADYIIDSYVHSHFALDNEGNLILKEGKPYPKEGIYRFKRKINPYKTAIVVMDPWVDMPSDFLNKQFKNVMEKYIIPLVKKAIERGHRVIIFTNNPNIFEYSTKIHSELENLCKSGKADLLYHQDFDDKSKLSNYLKSRDIDTLIYTGFASNICLLNRSVGMVSMKQENFKIFFIPEASAAIEYGISWRKKDIHNTVTKIISQSIGEIVEYMSFMNVVDF